MLVSNKDDKLLVKRQPKPTGDIVTPSIKVVKPGAQCEQPTRIISLGLLKDLIDLQTAAGFNKNGITILLNKGNPYDAIAWFDKAIAIEPGFLQAYVNRGMAYAILMGYGKAEENYHKAEESYLAALEINPRYVDAYIKMGDLEIQRGEIKAALLCFNKAVEIDPESADARYNRAFFRHFYQQDDEGALADLNIAIRISPTNAPAYALRAIIRAGRDEFGLAGIDVQLARENGYSGDILESKELRSR